MSYGVASKVQLISFLLHQRTSERQLLSSNSAQLLSYWACPKIAHFRPNFWKLTVTAVCWVGPKSFSLKCLSVYGDQKMFSEIWQKVSCFSSAVDYVFFGFSAVATDLESGFWVLRCQMNFLDCSFHLSPFWGGARQEQRLQSSKFDPKLPKFGIFWKRPLATNFAKQKWTRMWNGVTFIFIAFNLLKPEKYYDRF